MSTSKLAVFSSVLLALARGANAAPPPEPGTVVTLASVEKALGGKFTARSPEPGVLFYEETGTGYRQVNVYVSERQGSGIPDLRAQWESQGEPIEDVPGLGQDAMYRPQGDQVMAEMKDTSGQAFLLAVSVHNADSPEATKRFALELINLAKARATSKP